MQLNDMTLFRQQALIDGQWRDHMLTALTNKEWTPTR